MKYLIIPIAAMAAHYWLNVLQHSYEQYQLGNRVSYEQIHDSAVQDANNHCRREFLVYSEQKSCANGFVEAFKRDPWSPLWRKQVEIKRHLQRNQ